MIPEDVQEDFLCHAILLCNNSLYYNFKCFRMPRSTSKKQQWTKEALDRVDPSSKQKVINAGSVFERKVRLCNIHRALSFTWHHQMKKKSQFYQYTDTSNSNLLIPILEQLMFLSPLLNSITFLRVIACNSGTQMRVRDSSATRIFLKKIRMMQHRAQKITPKF